MNRMHAFKAIVTRYMPATNTRGSRVKATAEGGPRPHSVSIGYDDDNGTVEAHAAAAQALCDKLGWSGKLIPGGMPDGNGYAWVFTDFNVDHGRR